MASTQTPKVSATKAASTERAPLHKLHRSIVTINVGPEAYPFLVHEGRLRHVSTYFDTMLSGAFAEAESKIVKLDDVEVEVFEVFEDWLYTGRLDTEEWAKGRGVLLTKLYCFADRIQVPELQNSVIDRIGAIVNEGDSSATTIEAVVYAWDNTVAGSKFRSMLVQAFVYAIKDKGLTELQMDGYPSAFLADALGVCIKLISPSHGTSTSAQPTMATKVQPSTYQVPQDMENGAMKNIGALFRVENTGDKRPAVIDLVDTPPKKKGRKATDPDVSPYTFASAYKAQSGWLNEPFGAARRR